MQLFSFLKNRQLTKLDRTATSTEALAIKVVSDKNNYNQFKKLLENSSSNIFIELAIKYPELRFVQRYASEFPTNIDARFLYGAHLVTKAWEARSKAISSMVSSDQATAFLGFLNAAEFELHQVIRLDPKYKAVYAPLLRIQMGKSDKISAKKILKQAIKIAPNLMDYHIEQLTMLSPKWGGSTETMFSFARNRAEQDVTGILHGLIPAAHFEHWYGLDGNEAARYIKDTDIKTEINQAYLEVENAEFKEDYYSMYQHYLALNYFALVYSLMNEKKKAHKIFNVINGHYTYRPWANLGETSGLAYLKYKKLN